MDKETLYKMLDIEEPGDFQYFENLAELLECDEYIEYEDLYSLLKDVDKETLAQLIHDYFEELSDFVPQDASELFLLLDKIKLSLIGMTKNSEEENVLAGLAEELDRFRIWYSLDSSVMCTPIGAETESTGKTSTSEEEHSLRDALAYSRLEKLDGDKYEYDFSRCIDYPIDEYIMSFGDIISAAESDGDGRAPEGEDREEQYN